MDILLATLLIWIVLAIGSIIYIWCIKEHKSLKEGLNDWLQESANDR